MKTSTAIVLLVLVFFSWSCTKSNDETSDPGTPSFELDFTGAMNKKVTGNYSVCNFDEDETATGKPVQTAVVGLSSKAGELFTLVITGEGGIKTGVFPMDFTFDPFFSSSSTYTENSGTTLYGAATGSFKFISVSDKHINGTVDLTLEDGGNIINIKGKLNAVKP